MSWQSLPLTKCGLKLEKVFQIAMSLPDKSHNDQRKQEKADITQQRMKR